MEKVIRRWWRVIGRENLEDELKGKVFGWVQVETLFDGEAPGSE